MATYSQGYLNAHSGSRLELPLPDPDVYVILSFKIELLSILLFHTHGAEASSQLKIPEEHFPTQLPAIFATQHLSSIDKDTVARTTIWILDTKLLLVECINTYHCI